MPPIRTLLLFSLFGCVASPSPKPIDAGGAPRTNDAAISQNQPKDTAIDPRPADAATVGEAPAAMPSCPENPTARLSGGAIVTLPIEVVIGGAPMKFGEPNPVRDGATVTPLNLRFYISGVSLVKADGSGSVPVNIVKTDGSVAPYDVHFFNAEEPATAELRLRVPAGDYRELSFAFGLEDRCNAGPPERNPPLSMASQMTWPHTGYLFLRYEGRSVPGGMKSADAGVAGIPDGVHMGGFPTVLMAPTMRVPLSLAVGGNGTVTKRLRFVLDEVFKGALMNLPSQLPATIPHPPGMETSLGENLRQTAPMLPIFVAAP